MEKLIEAYNAKDFTLLYKLANELLNSEEDEVDIGYLHFASAVALYNLGDIDTAQRQIDVACEYNENSFNYLHLKAVILNAKHNYLDAAELYDTLLQANRTKELLTNVIKNLNDAGFYSKAIELSETFSGEEAAEQSLIINYANALKGLGRNNDALQQYALAKELGNEHLGAVRGNEAVILLEQNKLSESRELLESILEEGNPPSEIFVNLSLVYNKLKEFHETIKLFEAIREQRSLKRVHPKQIELSVIAFMKLKRGDDAINLIKSRYPNPAEMPFALLVTYMQEIGRYLYFDEYDRVSHLLVEKLKSKEKLEVFPSHMFHFCSSPMVNARMQFDAAQLLNLRASRIDAPKNSHQPRDKEKKIKIGYLSADYRNHPVAHLIAPVLLEHDREKFEIFGYDIGENDESVHTYRMAAGIDNYRKLYEETHEEIASKIQEDDIDILVDLTGYTEGCKPNVHYYKPAPIAVSYLGFMGTMGNPNIDYIIGDEYLVPEDLKSALTESVLYMPNCFQACNSDRIVKTVKRSDYLIEENQFIFGCFNNIYKLNRPMIKLWSEILIQVPNSIIWLVEPENLAKENLEKEFARLGIDLSRVKLFPRSDRAVYFGALSLIDVFLDTSPYNAGTTASDALYCGTPVVTLPGDILSSRMAGSMLHHGECHELIADNEQNYVDIAVKLATNSDFRRDIVNKVAKLKNTSLFSAVSITRHIEAAFIEAMDRFNTGKAADDIYIKNLKNITSNGIKFSNDLETFNLKQVKFLKQRLHSNGAEHLLEKIDDLLVSKSHNTENDERIPELLNDGLSVTNFFVPQKSTRHNGKEIDRLLTEVSQSTPGFYADDEMFVFNRSNSFVRDKEFVEALTGNIEFEDDRYNVWSSYIKNVSAFNCNKLNGDFVELGIPRLANIKTLISYLGEGHNRKIWIFDTQVELREENLNLRRELSHQDNIIINDGIANLNQNGNIPKSISFLSINTDQASDCLIGLETFFGHISTGGIIILEHYEKLGASNLKVNVDQWFEKKSYKVMPLPTGQGIIVKR